MSTPARKFFKSVNFLTPDAIRYGKLHPKVAYEISTGTGLFDRGMLCGVSVRYETPDGTFKSIGLSKCFTGENYDDATTQGAHYIGQLEQMFFGLKRNMGNREKYVMDNLEDVELSADYPQCYLFKGTEETFFVVDKYGVIRN